MSGNAAPPSVPTTDAFVSDPLDEPAPDHFDLEGDDEPRPDCPDPNDGANEATWWDVRQHTRAKRIEAYLWGKVTNSARAKYREVALYTPSLTHAEYRVLCHQLERGDPDLSNSFVKRETAARQLRMSLPTYACHLAALRKKQWVRTHEFRRYDGTQSSSGIQFCIPAGVLPSGRPWASEPRFDKHHSVQPRERRRKRRSTSE